MSFRVQNSSTAIVTYDKLNIKFRTKPLEYTNALWYLNIIGLEVFNCMQKLSACAPSFVTENTTSGYSVTRFRSMPR